MDVRKIAPGGVVSSALDPPPTSLGGQRRQRNRRGFVMPFALGNPWINTTQTPGINIADMARPPVTVDDSSGFQTLISSYTTEIVNGASTYTVSGVNPTGQQVQWVGLQMVAGGGTGTSQAVWTDNPN
jgi:hypothetical protein